MSRLASSHLFVLIIVAVIAIIILLIQMKVINLGAIFSWIFFKSANMSVHKVLNKTNETISNL